ncbi:hypothetical protein [Streptomyces sp. SHP 1-2]|uniref:hypothetical protein n=1 Tax=Streptomyces sp. SHP 1-2 TaxID=2769489 RepID=UPI0022390CFD|nr:hypothetical protein [Streptomyces sp. SHP 1-2]MCW5252237.1 hypothetical protein [Streptomyces sp. SHP 1-2]
MTEDLRTTVLEMAGQGISRREIARRTGLSRYKVGQLLDSTDQPTTRPPAADHPADQVADQPTVADHLTGRPADRPTSQLPAADHRGDRTTSSTPVADRPTGQPLVADGVADRPAGPLAGMNVRGWRALRRDLAALGQSGRPAEELVHQAVTAFAHAYRQALATGTVAAGQPVLITDLALVPGARPATAADRPTSHPAEPAEPAEPADRPAA